MRISDWSSDVCSSDLRGAAPTARRALRTRRRNPELRDRKRRSDDFPQRHSRRYRILVHVGRQRRTGDWHRGRSEEHTSELQSLMRISYAVFCLKKKNTTTQVLKHNNSVKNTHKQHTTTRLTIHTHIDTCNTLN